MKPCRTDKERKHRGNTSKAMKRMGTCPMCKRKGGMGKTVGEDLFLLLRCRYCGYEKGYYL